MAAASQAGARAGVELVAQRARQTRTVITTASASEASAHLYIGAMCAEPGAEKADSKMGFWVPKTLGQGA